MKMNIPISPDEVSEIIAAFLRKKFKGKNIISIRPVLSTEKECVDEFRNDYVTRARFDGFEATMEG